MIYPVSLRLDALPAGMLSCCCFCLGKFQSPRTGTYPVLLSSPPSCSSCLLPCILLLRPLHTASFSNFSSHHRRRKHLCLFCHFRGQHPYHCTTEIVVFLQQEMLFTFFFRVLKSLNFNFAVFAHKAVYLY